MSPCSYCCADTAVEAVTIVRHWHPSVPYTAGTQSKSHMQGLRDKASRQELLMGRNTTESESYRNSQ